VEASEKLRETPIPPIDAGSYWKRLPRETETLQKFSSIVAKSKENVDESEFRSFLDAVFPLASDVALFRIQPERTEHSDDKVAQAEKTLWQALKIYGEHTDAIPRAAPTALEQAHIATLFELVEKMVSPEGGAIAKAPRVAKEAAPLTDASVKFLAAGAVIGSKFQAAANSELSALRDWLIDHLEHAPQTCCGLLSKVLAVTLPSSAFTGEFVSVNAKLTGTAAEILTSAAADVLRSCICNALNPPCASCDDTGVLLACLTVDNCKVTEICNAVREFVLTPVNMRYWFPEIDHIGKEIAEWCCRCECPETDTSGFSRNESQFAGFSRVPPYVRALLTMLRYECQKPDARKDPTYRDRLSQLLEHGPSSKTVVAGAVSLADNEREMREAVQAATATLEENLSDARDELEILKQEHKKLHERIARLEKKPAKGQQEA
jgi:hypothetical protein